MHTFAYIFLQCPWHVYTYTWNRRMFSKACVLRVLRHIGQTVFALRPTSRGAVLLSGLGVVAAARFGFFGSSGFDGVALPLHIARLKTRDSATSAAVETSGLKQPFEAGVLSFLSFLFETSVWDSPLFSLAEAF